MYRLSQLTFLLELDSSYSASAKKNDEQVISQKSVYQSQPSLTLLSNFYVFCSFAAEVVIPTSPYWRRRSYCRIESNLESLQLIVTLGGFAKALERLRRALSSTLVVEQLSVSYL
jgi:hypothetical protein